MATNALARSTTFTSSSFTTAFPLKTATSSPLLSSMSSVIVYIDTISNNWVPGTSQNSTSLVYTKSLSVVDITLGIGIAVGIAAIIGVLCFIILTRRRDKKIIVPLPSVDKSRVVMRATPPLGLATGQQKNTTKTANRTKSGWFLNPSLQHSTTAQRQDGKYAISRTRLPGTHKGVVVTNTLNAGEQRIPLVHLQPSNPTAPVPAYMGIKKKDCDFSTSQQEVENQLAREVGLIPCSRNLQENEYVDTIREINTFSPPGTASTSTKIGNHGPPLPQTPRPVRPSYGLTVPLPASVSYYRFHRTGHGSFVPASDAASRADSVAVSYGGESRSIYSEYCEEDMVYGKDYANGSDLCICNSTGSVLHGEEFHHENSIITGSTSRGQNSDAASSTGTLIVGISPSIFANTVEMI